MLWNTSIKLDRAMRFRRLTFPLWRSNLLWPSRTRPMTGSEMNGNFYTIPPQSASVWRSLFWPCVGPLAFVLYINAEHARAPRSQKLTLFGSRWEAAEFIYEWALRNVQIYRLCIYSLSGLQEPVNGSHTAARTNKKCVQIYMTRHI